VALAGVPKEQIDIAQFQTLPCSTFYQDPISLDLTALTMDKLIQGLVHSWLW
jgi:hypothetical protein